MHMGKNNPKYTYTIIGSTVTVTAQKRDLVVIVDTFLKTSAQCSVAVKKKNKTL